MSKRYFNNHVRDYSQKVWKNIRPNVRLLLLLWLFILFSCSRKTHHGHDVITHASLYGYRLTSPALLYTDSTLSSDIFQLLKVGDTITTTKPIVLKKWNVVDHNGNLGYVNKPSLYAVYGPKSSYSKSISDLTNGFGFGLGFSSNRALSFDVLYKRSRIMYQAGIAYQFNGQRGKGVNERLSNYGITSLGSNSYFLVFTAGVNYWIAKKIAIGIDGCVGSTDYFTNYSDKRFSGDAYHLIDYSELAGGFGGKIHYLPKRYLLLTGGYNSLIGATLSISFVPYGSNL